MKPIFKHVDCVELHVSDLNAGIAYYQDGLGLRLLWRADTSAGLGAREGKTEIVLQTERAEMNVDFEVDDVDEALADVVRLGGEIICTPFDIPIGRCAVARDPWGNRYVLLDMRNGKYAVDEQKNVIGVTK